MARIEPFCGIRYTQTEISALVAPPYDVLSAQDKKALLDIEEQNIVAIDLPHVPANSAAADVVYERAAGDLVSWLDIRRLARDPQPALYVYHQSYARDGRPCTRKQFFARLWLEPLGNGSVFAHEQTFGGPKADRLKLTLATRCNLSPILALYPDAANAVGGALDEAIQGQDADATARLGDVDNSLWVVTDRAVIGAVQGLLRDKPVYIADGHHRYATALEYQMMQRDRRGVLLNDDPANFVMTVFCGMEDPGACIQPYYRSIPGSAGLTSARVREALAAAFEWMPIPPPRSESELSGRLKAAGPSAFGLYFPSEDVCGILRPRDDDPLAALEPRRHPAWRRLAYAIFHRHVMDEVVTPRLCGTKAPDLHYHKTLSETMEEARQSAGVAVLMPAVTMEQLRAVCAAGELLPQKSTYFYPKLATGLVINPLY